MGWVPPTIPAFLCDYCHRPIIPKVVYKQLQGGIVFFYCSLRCELLNALKRSK
jgi:hypothetical protein